MNKFIIFLTIFTCILLGLAMFVFGLAGRIESATEPEKESIPIGASAMVELGDGLWYNSETGIVYWWNGVINSMSERSTTPTPYYAPNGLLYKYNPNTKSLEEIE